jgi:hypothetical protein
MIIINYIIMYGLENMVWHLMIKTLILIVLMHGSWLNAPHACTYYTKP